MHERTITDPEVLTLIQEYVQEFYRTSGSALDIKEAYEGEYFYGGYDEYDGDEGIFIVWENQFNEFDNHHTQFINVTVHDLVKGDY